MPAGASLGALREPQFRRFFGAQAFSVLGDGMVPVALAFAVLDLTGSASDLGLVLAARLLPLVSLLLVGGVVADRLSRRSVMVASDLARFGSQGLMAALLIAGHAEIWQLAALQAVNGAATAFFNPASTGLLPATVSPARLQEANVLRGLSLAGGEIAGPVLAGILVATVGAGWALAVDATTFLISAALLGALRPRAAARGHAASFLADLRHGWGEFSRRTWVWVIVVTAALGNALNAAFVVLGPLVADRELGGPAAWAAIVSCVGIGSLLGGVLVLRLRPPRPLLAGLLAVGLSPLPMLLLGVMAPVVVIAAAGLLGGIGILMFNALWETTLQQHVPAESLSRVSAYDWFGSLAFQPLGLLIVGPVAAGVGVETTLLLAGVLQLGTVAAALAVPSVRQVAAQPATG